MRARNIKPGFFKCCELAEADYPSRLLFIGLWCYADREGRFEWKPKKIKAEIFPYDNVNVEKLLCNLVSLHFITRHGDVGYVENFKKHQNPHPHEAKSVLPQKPQQNQCHDMSVTLHELSAECNADSLIPDSLIPDTRAEFERERREFFDQLWSVYPKKIGKPSALKHYLKTVKTDNDINRINAALGAYLRYIENKEDQYIKHGSTWFNNWQDWEPEASDAA